MKKYVLAIIFFLLINGTAFASYKDALKLYQDKDYKGSLKILGAELVAENDMKKDSPNFKIRFLAAHNHWKLGNSQSTIAHFRRCMDIEKDNVNTYIDISLFLNEQKRYGDAVNFAKKGLNIKKDSMLYYVLGKISLTRKNYWKAVEYLEKANSLSQDMYFSYNSLGIALMHLKKYSQANTAFTIAGALYPDSPQIMNNIGMSYEWLGDHKKAYDHYKKSNLLNSENKQIAANLNRMKKKLDK